MKPFDWDIGQVPAGWIRKYGVPHVINGDFGGGPMAAMFPPPLPPVPGGIVSDRVCGYQFHYDQRHKVKAWLDWFIKEYDE